MGLPYQSESRLNLIIRHGTSALAALFVFFLVIILANSLSIPFYLGYRKFLVDITLISPWIDKILCATFAMASATIHFLLNRRDKTRPKSKLIVLYLLVTGSSAYALYSTFQIPSITLLALSWTLLLVYVKSFRKSNAEDGSNLSLILLYGALILLVVEIGSVARWILHLLDPSPVFAVDNWAPAFMEAQLSNLLYPLLPVLILFFAYSWLGEFTFKGLLSDNWKTTTEEDEGTDIAKGLKSVDNWVIIALAAFLVAVLIGYYNYAIAGDINPGFPGTDVPDYIRFLKDMMGGNFAHALGQAVQNERVFFLIFQYLIYQFFGMAPAKFVTFVMPAVLSLVLMAAAYFLVRSSKPKFHAATAMVVSVLSFTVTVGLYAGFYANWLAIATVFLFYGLLLTAFRGGRNKWLLIPAALSSMAVMYIHLWTWILLIVGIMTAYAVLSLLLIWAKKISYHRGSLELKILVLLIVLNLGTAYLTYYLGSFKVGTEKILKEIKRRARQVSLSNISKLNTYLDRTFKWYVGGFYAYAPIFLFSILGVVSILDYRDSFNRLMLTWLLLCSSMIFFEFPMHARFLYMTPFSIYTTLGILYGANKISAVAENNASKKVVILLFWLFYLIAIFLLLNYGIRSVVIKQFGAPGLTVFARIS